MQKTPAQGYWIEKKVWFDNVDVIREEDEVVSIGNCTWNPNEYLSVFIVLRCGDCKDEEGKHRFLKLTEVEFRNIESEENEDRVYTIYSEHCSHCW